jgi:hypothetical protein
MLAYFNRLYREDYMRYYKLATHMRRANPMARQLVVPPPLDKLFGQSAAYCVNQHHLAKFPGVPDSPLVKNIGGILVENNSDIKNKPLDMPSQPKPLKTGSKPMSSPTLFTVS